MAAFDDLKLDRSDEWATPPPVRHRPGVVIAVAVLAVAAGVLAWWLTRDRTAPGAAEIAAPAPVASAPPLAATPPRTTSLPPLDELDPSFRDIVRRLTSSAIVERWLATSNLARQAAALVQGAADGRMPMRFLAPLRPSGNFAVVERQGRTAIAPASHARFDALAAAVTAMDPGTIAEAYRTLVPRLEDAHDELGSPDGSFDASFRRVLTSLIETPVPSGPIAVIPKGGVYAFADPSLEALSPAQKLLLRSGPENARRIQAHLVQLRDALETRPTTTP